MAVVNVPANRAHIGFGPRFLALLIDAVVLAVVSYVIGLVVGGAFINLIISAGYFIYLHSAAGKGQTLGKRVLKIQVVKTDGTFLTFGGAAIRFFATIVSFLPLLLGFFWVIFDSQKQAFHDKIAGTYVVSAIDALGASVTTVTPAI